MYLTFLFVLSRISHTLRQITDKAERYIETTKIRIQEYKGVQVFAHITSK